MKFTLDQQCIFLSYTVNTMPTVVTLGIEFKPRIVRLQHKKSQDIVKMSVHQWLQTSVTV